MTVLNLQVGASADDANEKDTDGSINLIDFVLTLGHYAYWTHCGLRFTGVSGLSGATISAATLTFRASTGDSGSFIGDWYAHDAAAPGTFTSATNNISDTAQRPRTTATCEGDGSDFGNWTSGQDHTFTGDGTNTIAQIIQELADSYDPSAIALLWIRTSGTGERAPWSYNWSSTLAPKLDITYTAGSGDQTATPDAVAIPVSIPAPTLVSGAVSLTPDPVAINVNMPLPTVVPGTVTLTPDAVAIPVSVPQPTVVAGTVTLTPDPVAIPIVLPSPWVVGGVVVYPDPVTIPIAIPDPTIVIGAVTLTPDPIAIPIVLPDLQLDYTINPDPVALPIAIPAATAAPGAVTLTPDAVAIPIVIPFPTVLGAVSASYVQWGVIERYINPDQYATGAVFFIEVGIYTIAALGPVTARLFNVTDGVAVSGSEVTGTSTSYEVLRSSTFSLSSGLRKYRLEFGGEPGGAYYCHGGDVKVVAS